MTFMAKLLEVDKKYQIIFLCILVFIVILGLGVFFVSSHDGKKEEEETVAIVLNSGDLVINYLEGNDFSLDSFDNKRKEYVFSVTNTGSTVLYYSINLIDCVVNNEVSVKLKTEAGEELFSGKLQDGENSLYSLTSIEAGLTERYILILNEEENNVNVKGIIEVVNESLIEQTFADLLLKNNNLMEAKTIPGSNTSVLDEGLIKDEDDYGTTYYFRGAVVNNYLMIGEHQFRVVRINGNGTVRVVLDEPVDLLYAFNENINLAVNDSAILSNASILSNLNNWYDTNLGLYSNYLTTGNYCSDNNFINIGANINYSNVYQRIFVNNQPTFKCTSYITTNKIGLLSADEIALAGAYRNNENKKYYLYNANIDYDVWTSSSVGVTNTNELSIITLSANGSLGSSLVNNTLKVRPVVNISLSANVRGEGTIASPYVLIVN